VYLRSMEDFGAVNSIYKTFMGTSPPTRACVAIDLAPEIHLQLDCLAYAENTQTDRQALHVQSLSYWAPANIGPYSQAVTVDGWIFISGQIGMVPSNLCLPNPLSPSLEVALSLQHVCSILRAFQETCAGGSSWNPKLHCAIYWTVDQLLAEQLAKEHFTPMFDTTPSAFIGVTTLPKGAIFETQVVGHTNTPIVDEDGDSTECVFEFKQGDVQGENTNHKRHWELSANSHGSWHLMLFGSGQEELSTEGVRQLHALAELREVWDSALSSRVMYCGDHHCLWRPVIHSAALSTPAYIPVRFIMDRSGRRWDSVVCVMGIKVQN